MAAFLLRRFAALVLVLFCVVTITFCMIRLAPGSPFDRDRKIAPAIERELRLKYHLEGPEGRAAGASLGTKLGLGRRGRRLGDAGSFLQQYRDYLRDLLHGDLRLSIQVPQPHGQRNPRANPAGFADAGRAGVSDRHDRRGLAGGVRGGAAQRRVRRRGDVRGAAGDQRADVRDGAAVRAGVRAEAGGAAGRRVGDGGERGDARAGAGRALRGVHRAADAFEHVGSARAGFRPHGPRQGACRSGRSFTSTR